MTTTHNGQFKQGNRVALKHGVTSPARVAAKAAEVHDDLTVFAPWLDAPEYTPVLQQYLAAESHRRLLWDYIQKVSDDRGVGAVPARTWEMSLAATRLASKLAADLGLSPLGKARLQQTAAGAELNTRSLGDLIAEGAETARAAEEREAAAITTDAEEIS